MSFIQKLIERKTQATGSAASQHLVDEDQAEHEAGKAAGEHGVTMVDIVDLDDPDASVPDDELSAEPAASEPEPRDNVLSLTDPFAQGDETEADDDFSDLTDLEAEFEEEIETVDENSEATDQTPQADSDQHDVMDFEDGENAAEGNEAVNIWDIDIDSDGEAESDAPDEAPVADAQPSEPHMPRVQSVETANLDIEAEQAEETIEAPEAITPEPAAPEPVVAEAAPKAPEKRRVGRVKTRLLGFEHSDNNPGANLFDPVNAHKKVEQQRFPVGWFVVVEGPGRGEAFALHAGMSQIGRGDDQAVQLDFGDETISRDNHAAIVYDIETHTFLMGHGGKANVVRLNSKPLICTEEVKNSDLIRIGETTLRLVVLCNAEFHWEEQDT